MAEIAAQVEIPRPSITKDQLVGWSKKLEPLNPEAYLSRDLLVVTSKKDQEARKQRLGPDNTNSKARREAVTNIFGIDLTDNLIVPESISRPAYKLNQRLTGEIMYQLIASAHKFDLIPEAEQDTRLAFLNDFIELSQRKWQHLHDLAIKQGQKPEDIDHKVINKALKDTLTDKFIPAEPNHDPLPPNGLDTILAKFNQLLDFRQVSAG